MAHGGHVTLLGDHDWLAPNYFKRLREVIERFAEPELIYGAIYQFIHPGVIPSAPAGRVCYLKWGFFFSDHSEPFPLSTGDVLPAVVGSLHLRRILRIIRRPSALVVLCSLGWARRGPFIFPRSQTIILQTSRLLTRDQL
jgi:hypothetical protein